jgi:hypothetical protein
MFHLGISLADLSSPAGGRVDCLGLIAFVATLNGSHVIGNLRIKECLVRREHEHIRSKQFEVNISIGSWPGEPVLEIILPESGIRQIHLIVVVIT